MGNKCLEGTRIRDLRGEKFGRLTVVDFDWSRYTADKHKKELGKISQIQKYWMCECQCGKILSVYSGNLKNNHSSSCGKCESFKQWCLNNNYQDYLDLWDYELNDKNPSDVSYANGSSYYFKCNKGEHPSCKVRISNITSGKSCVKCKMCNSLGEYLLNSNGIFSSNNNENPFDISKCSSKKVLIICNDCMKEKSIRCHDFVANGLMCDCGDGDSYPNKFSTSLLMQLNVCFEKEKTFEWANKKRYDHYIESFSLIIENHGMQHYTNIHMGGNKRDERLNDDNKRRLANNNINHYIELDCRKSELKWIKQSVMNSELPNILNFKEGDIDWVECDRYATKNLVKEICYNWEKHNKGTQYICNTFKLSRSTVIKYLKQGTLLGWCNYNPKEELRKACEINRLKVQRKHTPKQS